MRQELEFAVYLLLAPAHPHGRAVIHLPPVRQAIPRESGSGATPEGDPRRHQERAVRSVRPHVLDATERRGSQADSHGRAAVRLQRLRQNVQAEGLPVRAQSHAHRRVPVQVQPLRPDFPHAAAADVAHHQAHRREAARVRRVRPSLPHQIRAEAAPADPLRRETLALHRLQPLVPPEALLS